MSEIKRIGIDNLNPDRNREAVCPKRFSPCTP
jgi:hypothetical protein